MLKFWSCVAIGIMAIRVDAQTESDWPQFLGPQRNGISVETELLDSWPENGPQEMWRVAGGVGMSGLAIRRGRLLTMVQTAGQQRVICLHAKTGKTLWRTPVAPAYHNGQGKGPRATPTIVDNVVVVFTGEGVLLALRFTDGKILWSHDSVKEQGGQPAAYGMSCSPLVVANKAIVTVGAPAATVVAYDLKSGNLAWKAGQGEASGYSSPTLLDVDDQQQVILTTGSSVLGLVPETGKMLWRYPYPTDFNCNIATPVAFNGHVLISAGENHGSVLLQLLSDGERFEPFEVWSSLGTKSVLRNEWQTSIFIDGYLYGFDNVGAAGPVTHLTCIDAASGQRAWQVPRFGKGNLIAADGKLFISTIEGELVLVAATPGGYEELGRATVMGATRQAPALSAGLLYLRDDREIVCWQVREK